MNNTIFMKKTIAGALMGLVILSGASVVFADADVTAPIIEITAPLPSTVVGGVVTLYASTTDNVGVAGVKFLLDGSVLGAEDSASPFNSTWDSTGAVNGVHTLLAVAHDAAGNVATSAPVTITVSNSIPDTSAPIVSLVSPLNAGVVSGTSVLLSATAVDNVGVEGVQFIVDGANVGAEDTSAPYSVNWNTTGVANGTHTLLAVARDAAHNTATSSVVSVTVNNVIPDVTLPSVSITSPTNGITASGTLTLTAQASDNIAVAGVKFLIDGAVFGSEMLTAPYTVSLNTTTLRDGVHTVSAIARDTSGNTATATAMSVTIANTTQPNPSCNCNRPHEDEDDDGDDCQKDHHDNREFGRGHNKGKHLGWQKHDEIVVKVEMKGQHHRKGHHDKHDQDDD